MSDPSRLLTTNWNGSVYGPADMATLIDELVVHSLMYEQVLIPAQEIVTNKAISTHLQQSAAVDLLIELLRHGCVRLLLPDPDSYPGTVSKDPAIEPLAARAELHAIQGSLAGEKWAPTADERRLCARIDRMILDARDLAISTQRPFPKENRFASELKQALLCRHANPLFQDPPLNDITDELAEMFIGFCDDPSLATRFLESRDVVALTPDRFYRTAAYQCFRLFQPHLGMMRLVESVYAACVCDLESAEGRFDQERLPLVPTAASVADDGDGFDHHLSLVPMRAALPLVAGAAVGETVAAVRGSAEFADFQAFLNAMRAHHVELPMLTSQWEAVAARYAREAAQRSSSTVSPALSTWFAMATGTIAAGLSVSLSEPAFGFAGPLSGAVGYLGGRLVKAIRTGMLEQRTMSRVRDSLDIRCARVSLHGSAR